MKTDVYWHWGVRAAAVVALISVVLMVMYVAVTKYYAETVELLTVAGAVLMGAISLVVAVLALGAVTYESYQYLKEWLH